MLVKIKTNTNLMKRNYEVYIILTTDQGTMSLVFLLGRSKKIRTNFWFLLYWCATHFSKHLHFDEGEAM